MAASGGGGASGENLSHNSGSNGGIGAFGGGGGGDFIKGQKHGGLVGAGGAFGANGNQDLDGGGAGLGGAIQILAKHITASFTAADKVYDGTTAATVTSRGLIGVVDADAVILTGGKAVFTSKYAGTHTVTLFGATLGVAAARNYVLDSVAITTAAITPKALAAAATTQATVNAAMSDNRLVRVVVN